MGLVRSLESLLTLQHGADSVKALGDEVSFVIGERISLGSVRVQLVIQERIGENGGNDGLERYGASQSREPVTDH